MKDIIKVYLADDHQILIEGLKSFFQEKEGYEVVGAANDGLTLLQEVQILQPHVVLLDLNMPRLDGFKTLDRLRKDHPNIQVVILSNYHQSELIKDSKAKGASGYLLKNGSMAEVLEAIHEVANGRTYFKSAEQEVDNSNFFLDEFMKKHHLTKREVEIIKLITKEFSSKEIADKLFISEFTVSTHRRNILQKLNIKNASGLVNFARDNGIY